MPPISAIIISFNEASRIADCIKSMDGVVDEIVLVDNGSTDDTQTIARNLGAKVFEQSWLGYGPQKNFAVSKTSNDWILQIDCDERLDATLRQSMLSLKNGLMAGAYEIPFLHNYYGRFIYHGLQFPDKKLRIWNKQDFVWDDKNVHEKLLMPVGTPVQKLQGFMLHYSYKNLEHHIAKSNRYSSEGAEELFRRGKKNYRWKLWVSPAFTFIKAYLIKRGFLDGWHGFMIAKMEASTTFMKYAKLWEKYHEARATASSQKP